MNVPPIFIELTNSDTGETESVLLAHIHHMREFTDPQRLRSGTIIRTWNELGAISPQGIQCSYREFPYREKKKEIYKKIKQCMKNYHDFLKSQVEDYLDDDNLNLYA